MNDQIKLVVRDGEAELSPRLWEQVVFAEVVLPGIPNVYGDISTAEEVKQFAYEYARQGYGIDVGHDKVNVRNQQAFVCESFIARDDDPDFVAGAWVVGMKILDGDLWQQILAGEINGYSYMALVSMLPVEILGPSERQVAGTTEPDPADGHTHDYALIVDVLNHPMVGATSETNGHSHRISVHTVTDVAEGHNHRYQVIQY